MSSRATGERTSRTTAPKISSPPSSTEESKTPVKRAYRAKATSARPRRLTKILSSSEASLETEVSPSPAIKKESKVVEIPATAKTPEIQGVKLSHTKAPKRSFSGKPKANNRPQKSDAYLRTKVKTASGGELVIMLYEKAISNLTIACDLLAGKSEDASVLMEIGSNIRNAQEIILELLYSLDIETGSEFARKMSAVYSFMNKELSEALIEKSEIRIKPILDQLKVLLDAWRRAHEQLKAQEQLIHPSSEGIQIG